MPRSIAYAATTCVAVSAWLVRGELALQSSAPGAPKVGLLPPVWELALFIVAAGCVVFLLRPSTDRVLPMFATLLCVLPWVPGVRSPALVMWTGPLAVAVWCGSLTAAALAGRGGLRAFLTRLRAPALADPRYAPAFATVAACAFFAVVWFGARNAVPAGDEPHYLIITQSLLYDGDLQIENNHARRDYESYFRGSLQPDFWRRGKNGAVYSVHAPGLPALVLPAFAIGGYRGVAVFLIVVAGLAAGLLWRLAHLMTGRPSAAWFAVAATASATPVAFHAFTVFPDGPAGLILLSGIWALLRLPGPSVEMPLGSPRTWALHGLALALLPWMHTRLAALAGPVGLAILLRMWRARTGTSRVAAFLAAPAISAAGWFLFFYVLYGTPSPAAPWTRLVTSWSFIPRGLAGILFDQQFGALLYAPVLLLCAAGWFPVWGRNRRLAVELAAIALPYMLVTTRLWIWWGGWSAPARFWTPLFWVGGTTLAAAWASFPAMRSRAARGATMGLLLVSALTTIGLAYSYGGRLAYNVRDGYARWFDWVSTLTDLPLALPSFFRAVDQPRVFALEILIVAAAGALTYVLIRWLDRRVRGSGAFALALLVTFAVGAMLTVAAILRLDSSPGVRASVAQLRLLDAAQEARRLGVLYRGPSVRLLGADELVGALRIESPPRLVIGPGSPALVLPGWVPSGTYKVSATAADAAPWELRVLRAGPPILHGSSSSGQRLDFRITLPVDVPALILRGSGLTNASLQPIHVGTSRERFRPQRANSARRYGGTVVWFVDERAFDDPDGMWIKGDAADARVVLQPDAGSWLRVLVRNGPVDNEAFLATDAGDWAWSAPMKAGQENEVRVPVDPARGAVMLRMRSLRGFRPSEIDPGSRDTRLLGVWLSPRLP